MLMAEQMTQERMEIAEMTRGVSYSGIAYSGNSIITPKGVSYSGLAYFLHLEHGVSMSDAIAAEIMNNVKTQPPMETPKGMRDYTNPFYVRGKDGTEHPDISMILRDEYDAMRRTGNRAQLADSFSGNSSDVAEKAHEMFNRLLQRYTDYVFKRYYADEADGRASHSGMSYQERAVDDLAQENSHYQKQKSSFAKEKAPTDYNPLDAHREQRQERLQPSQYQSAEMLAYQLLVSQHAYQGILQPNNSASYLAANGSYEVAATEGYIGSGIGYLTLSISRQQEELQRYTLLLKYHDERARKVSSDDAVAEGIDEMLSRLTRAESLRSEEVIEMVVKILSARKDSDDNLALTEAQLRVFEKSLKEMHKIESHDKAQSVVMMLEVEKSLRLRQLFVRKTSQKKSR